MSASQKNKTGKEGRNMKLAKGILVAVIFAAFCGLCGENSTMNVTVFALMKLAFIGLILSAGYLIAKIEEYSNKTKNN